MESSDPSRSPVIGSGAGMVRNSESVSSKKRKRKDKNYKLHDYIRKFIDDTLGVTHLEPPSKRRKLVKKQLTFGIGLESKVMKNQKNQRKESR